MRFPILLLLLAFGVARGELKFPELLKEIHLPADKNTVQVDYEFSNTGKKPVKIRHYDAACSCLAAQVKEGKLDYAPGEKGVIRVTFNMGNFSGTIDKTTAIWLDNDPKEKPSIILTVRVHIPELVKIEPKTLRWSLGEPPTAKTITIKIDHEKPIKVLKVTGSNDNFPHQLKTVKEGAEYHLNITPKDTSVPGIGIMRIETDCPIARHRIRQAFTIITRANKGT